MISAGISTNAFVGFDFMAVNFNNFLNERYCVVHQRLLMEEGNGRYACKMPVNEDCTKRRRRVFGFWKCLTNAGV